MKVQEGYVIDTDLPPPDAQGRKEAEESSRDCTNCGGWGLVTIDATDRANRYRTTTATCLCRIGRWIRAWYAINKGQWFLARCPDVRDVISGKVRGWKYSRHGAPGVTATEEEDEDARPASRPTREQINKLFRRPA